MARLSHRSRCAPPVTSPPLPCAVRAILRQMPDALLAEDEAVEGEMDEVGRCARPTPAPTTPHTGRSTHPCISPQRTRRRRCRAPCYARRRRSHGCADSRSVTAKTRRQEGRLQHRDDGPRVEVRMLESEHMHAARGEGEASYGGRRSRSTAGERQHARQPSTCCLAGLSATLLQAAQGHP